MNAPTGKHLLLRQDPPLLDPAPEASLDLEVAREAARKKYQRPFLILDTALVRQKARRFRAALPRVRPHYAVKANPDRRVIRSLAEEGCGFAVTSGAELELLTSLSIPAKDIRYSNPVKSHSTIAAAATLGVNHLVIDSVDELRRLHSINSSARLYLRIATPSIGSERPFSGKFGAGAAEAREIVAVAARLGADLAGVAFHVGSQCRNPENWRVGIEKARTLFETMTKAGLKPRLLDLGGGFPVRHARPVPSIEAIGAVVNEALQAFPPEVEVIAEPGRYLVSEAGYFVCRVLGTTTRGGKRWMHWDAGLFGRLLEAGGGLKLRFRTDRAGPDVPWHVAGPTCDSADVVLR
ncbi:MAG TPA: type III PLP-dependent enzyme, partial [Burkholderiales bacterium]|nr:type III PLP-dependent enzyme [Burkholderiales bacterium]